MSTVTFIRSFAQYVDDTLGRLCSVFLMNSLNSAHFECGQNNNAKFNFSIVMILIKMLIIKLIFLFGLFFDKRSILPRRKLFSLKALTALINYFVI